MSFFEQSPENRQLRKLRKKRLSLLSDWYGSEFAATEIAAHFSQPHPLGGGVRDVMAQLETPEERALRSLREQWPEVAGAWISRMTVPAAWRDGVLFLEVRHNALLRELKPSLEIVREAVARRGLGCPCTEVRLSIAGGAAGLNAAAHRSK